MESLVVTVRDVARAMTKDKTPKAIGSYSISLHDTDTEDVRGVKGSRCAVGGAAKVLGVDEYTLGDILGQIHHDGVPMPQEQAKVVKKSDGQFPPDSLAAAIFNWNDTTEKTKAELGQMILDKADEDTLNREVRDKDGMWIWS